MLSPLAPRPIANCWLLVDSGCSHVVCCLLLAVGVDGCCWLVVVAAVVAVAVYVVLPVDGVRYVAPAAVAFALAHLLFLL